MGGGKQSEDELKNDEKICKWHAPKMMHAHKRKYDIMIGNKL